MMYIAGHLFFISLLLFVITRKDLVSFPTLRFLFQLPSPLLHVFLRNTLHAVDLQLDVGSAGYRIWNAIYRFLVHLE